MAPITSPLATTVFNVHHPSRSTLRRACNTWYVVSVTLRGKGPFGAVRNLLTGRKDGVRTAQAAAVSVHLTVPPLPIRRPEVLLEQLSGGVAGEGFTPL